jgi:hypothetical protein
LPSPYHFLGAGCGFDGPFFGCGAILAGLLLLSLETGPLGSVDLERFDRASHFANFVPAIYAKQHHIEIADARFRMAEVIADTGLTDAAANQKRNQGAE